MFCCWLIVVYSKLKSSMNSLTVDGNSNNNLNDFVYEKKYAVERSVSDYYNATTTVSSALSTDDSYYGQSYYYDYYVNTNAILGNTSTAASATSVIGNQSAGAAGKYKFTNDPLRIFYYNIESKLSILPILLMIAGTLGNSLAFYVLTRKKLRTQSTMLYFAALTVMDTLSLYQWFVYLKLKKYIKKQMYSNKLSFSIKIIKTKKISILVPIRNQN